MKPSYTFSNNVDHQAEQRIRNLQSQIKRDSKGAMSNSSSHAIGGQHHTLELFKQCQQCIDQWAQANDAQTQEKALRSLSAKRLELSKALGQREPQEEIMLKSKLARYEAHAKQKRDLSRQQ